MYGVDLQALLSANGITDKNRVETGRRLFIPLPVQPPVRAAAPSAEIERLVGHPRGGVAWRTITIHHSATRYGNAKVFGRYHRKKGMSGLFYHFLIGNGNGLGDGKIEAGWRWGQQREVNRPRDIQICLVGNFMKQQVSERQYQALKGLIAVLRRRYAIGTGGIRRHCDVADDGSACPGKNFPYSLLIREMRGE